MLEGTNFTKDLVSEPGNILHPDEYSKRILKLKKLGLKIKAYNKNNLKRWAWVHYLEWDKEV